MSAVGGACGAVGARQRRLGSICGRAGTYPIIAPSSDTASSSNWTGVGVDGVKMAAALLLLHDCGLSVPRRRSQGGRVGGSRRLFPTFTLPFRVCGPPEGR